MAAKGVESRSTPSQGNTVHDRAIANQGQRPMFEHVQLRDTKEERKFETFFSRPEFKFGDIVLEEDDKIPTEMFLKCAHVLLPFFDTLGPTIFMPFKNEINCNLEKIARTFNRSPFLCPTLQDLIDYEIGSNSAGRGSATEALLWLKRAMEFIYLFLGEVSRGEQALDVAAGKAYSKSLQHHHSWWARGAFQLALMVVPYYTDFLGSLGSNRSKESDTQVVKDMTEFAQDLGEITIILNQFLIHRNVEVEH